MLTSLAALAAAGALPRAQQPFRSRAEAVRIDVLVTDGGRTVPGLIASDFDLRDATVPQRVALVEVEPLPLNIILALDTSASVAGARLQALTDACRSVLDSMRDRDRVALLSFSSRIRLLAPLTPSRQQIGVALARLEAAGTTSLRDAAFAGLALREEDPGRTVMLLFSDGADTSSWLGVTRVIETAKRTDVVVYPVGLVGTRTIDVPVGADFGAAGMRGSVKRTITTEEAGPFLESLAQVTGGRVVLAGGDADLRASFTKTLAEFRNRYVLTYIPAGVPAAGWHSIDVRLKGKRGKVTARRGYFVQ